MADIPPVPMRSPVLGHSPSDPERKQPFLAVLSKDLVNFLNTLRGLLGSAAQFIASVGLDTQSATIVTTAMPGTLQEGLVRVTYSLRISRAATVSSSAQLTLGWTTNSVSCTQTFAAVTGNTTATQQSGSIMVFTDAGSTISYAVVYASVGATSMQYSLDVVAEDIP